MGGSILGLRPSLLCVHSESRGARIPEARGLEPRRRASQGGVLPSTVALALPMEGLCPLLGSLVIRAVRLGHG